MTTSDIIFFVLVLVCLSPIPELLHYGVYLKFFKKDKDNKGEKNE